MPPGDLLPASELRTNDHAVACDARSSNREHNCPWLSLDRSASVSKVRTARRRLAWQATHLDPHVMPEDDLIRAARWASPPADHPSEPNRHYGGAENVRGPVKDHPRPIRQGPSEARQAGSGPGGHRAAMSARYSRNSATSE